MTSFKEAFSEPTEQDKQWIEEIKQKEQKLLDELGYSDEEIELGKKCYEHDYGNGYDLIYVPTFSDYMDLEFRNWQMAFQSYKNIIKDFANAIYQKTTSNSYDSVTERLQQEGTSKADVAIYIRKNNQMLLEALEDYTK